MVPSWLRMMAHCAAKQTSAMVATERPTTTLESQVSYRQMRCTSARGTSDRNAQSNAAQAERGSILPTSVEVEGASAGCARNSRYSATQIAMFAALTSVRKTPHQATGFDQARVADRARHSRLIPPL